jgi:hypothetical protein
MIVLAILFPWLYFFVKGKTIPGIICFVLYLTIIGWDTSRHFGQSTHSLLSDNRIVMKESLETYLGSTAMNIYS